MAIQNSKYVKEEELIKIQNELKSKISKVNMANSIKLIAGVDLAYFNKNDKEYAICVIVILDYKTHEVIEMVSEIDEIKCPYIPGCLSFREIPLFLKTNEKLKHMPSVYMFDGNGYLHPRHMGLATHAGILLEKPTIGVAKSYFKVKDTNFIMPINESCSYTDIIINNDIYGCVFRAHKNVKPIFISTGNLIDLNTAKNIVSSLITKESRIPLPTRLADIEVNRIRKIRDIELKPISLD